MDVENIFDDSLRPKRKYQKKTQLSVSQRKKFKDNIPVQLTPTVEFKSQRQLCLEKRNKNKEESSHSLEIAVPPQEPCQSLLAAANSTALSEPHSSADDVETDYYSDGNTSNTPSHYVQSCIRKLANSNLFTKVLHKCEEKGLTRHFMALITQIADGTLPVTNMTFLLSLEVALLHSLKNLTQMHYRKDTSLFWEVAFSVGGPQLMRLFSSDKYFGQVNSGE